MDIHKRVEVFCNTFMEIKCEIAKFIVGHEQVIHDTISCLLAGGHVLLEGAPGLGKTLMVQTLSETLELAFSRIQFTPDMMPADIIGTNFIIDTASSKEFQFQRGPVFGQIVLADEINRATPKAQSALLEAMQENKVTVGGIDYHLPKPFFVLATQNPIEMEGTYPLPEAQLDRFLFKLLLHDSSHEELVNILVRTTGVEKSEVTKVADSQLIIQMKSLVREIIISQNVINFAARLVIATQPQSSTPSKLVKQFVRYGSSPRGAQALVLGAKINALLDGRFNVSFDDLKSVALPALRHRLILNFEGDAEGISSDVIINDILHHVPTEPDLVTLAR